MQAGIKIGRQPNGRFIIVDVKREQLSSAGVERLIVNTTKQDGYYTPVSLPQDPGQAGKAQIAYLIQQLAGYSATASTETGDKTVRAQPFASQAEVGNVDILAADWNDAYLDELCVFPAGQYDDQVDGTSRAFNVLVMNPFDISALL